MFEDRRSKRIVLVAHCVLNQNAKIDRCAHYPGAMREVARVLLDSDVGIVQMPCPELVCLGLDRQANRGAAATVESEDTRVALRMSEGAAGVACGDMAAGLVQQAKDYRKHGFEIVGVVGINGSPTCGVETTWRSDREARGPGVFIQKLAEGLEAEGIPIAMRGIKAREPDSAVAAVKELLAEPPAN